MDAIYNYLLPTYTPNPSSRNNTVHKKSELREHYGNIVKMTKRSPLYFVRLSNEKQKFVLNVKEAALNLKSLTDDLVEEEKGYFNKRAVYSEEEGVVSAKMIEGKEEETPNPFTIKVKSLARPQINEGIAQFESGAGLPEGKYVFQVKMEDNAYELPFEVKEGDTNLDVASKLVNYINRTDVGLQANLSYMDRSEMVRIELQSFKTGDAERLLFELSDVSKPGDRGLVDYFGLNRFTQTPRSAVFDMNGVETRALSNRFILNGSLEVQLHKASEGVAQIGYKNDAKGAVDKVKEVVGVWNQLVDKAYDYAAKAKSYPKLANELKAIARGSRSDLESAGIVMEEGGRLSVDSALATQAFQEGDLKELFSKDSPFVGKVKEEMGKISTDPMEYVDKKMVSYPNIRKNGFSYTYMTSMYSGMLFNHYC